MAVSGNEEQEPHEKKWEEVKRLAEGTPSRLEAVRILWAQNPDLAKESVQLTLKLAGKEQPREIRLASAQQFAQRRDRVWRLFRQARETMIEDSDEEIRKLARQGWSPGGAEREEMTGLHWAFRVVMLVLVATLIACVVLSILLLSRIAQQEAGSSRELSVVLLCVVTGTLGSAVSAMISVADRVSHGWELANGEKWPQDAAEKDMFVARMIPWFLVRPFLGAVMGFLVYVGVVGSYLIALRGITPADFSPQGLAFLALLGGLFAKTFLEKLKSAFDNLLGA